MEEITRRDGIYYYGDRKCSGADEAYERYRREYHASIGRDAFRRLDRLGQRVERVHGSGFCSAIDYSDCIDEFRGYGKIRYRMVGMLGISYSRIVGLYDYGHVPDTVFERWLEWAFSRGSGALKLVGKKQKTGRTSKRLKTRFR